MRKLTVQYIYINVKKGDFIYVNYFRWLIKDTTEIFVFSLYKENSRIRNTHPVPRGLYKHTYNGHRKHQDSGEQFVDHSKCFPVWGLNPQHLVQ